VDEWYCKVLILYCIFFESILKQYFNNFFAIFISSSFLYYLSVLFILFGILPKLHADLTFMALTDLKLKLRF